MSHECYGMYSEKESENPFGVKYFHPLQTWYGGLNQTRTWWVHPFVKLECFLETLVDYLSGACKCRFDELESARGPWQNEPEIIGKVSLDFNSENSMTDILRRQCPRRRGPSVESHVTTFSTTSRNGPNIVANLPLHRKSEPSGGMVLWPNSFWNWPHQLAIHPHRFHVGANGSYPSLLPLVSLVYQ